MSYRTVGNQRIKREYIREEAKRLERWFDRQGEWVGESTPPDTRSRLWYCLNLFAHGEAKYADLADRIIRATPVDKNGFEPFPAAELLLRFPGQLTPAATKHLRGIVRAHLANCLEVRFGIPGTNNFACMETQCLLAAGQLGEGYEWTHPLGGIPEIYNAERVRELGWNGLRLLDWHSRREDVFAEFNSPTYTPISLHSLAKIVELSDDPEARELAREVEGKLWREVLGLYHPNLGLSCGPWSRAYRQDMLGHTSLMRILLCYCGIGKERSIEQMQNDAQHCRQVPLDPDAAFRTAITGWHLANRYHVPAEALEELRHRQYPHRFSARVSWRSFGYVDPRTRKYVPVQGTLQPGGEAEIGQIQETTWALGWRTRQHRGHSFPLTFHYATAEPVRSLREVRNVTVAVPFHQAPPEWEQHWSGRQVEAGNFNVEGQVLVTPHGRRVEFSAHPWPELAAMPSNELSLNSFVPIHFGEVQEITLNGERYGGKPLAVKAKQGVCRVRDAGFVYEIAYDFPRVVELRLWRWANFLRFGGFWYAGKRRYFTAKELGELRARGSFRIMRTPG